MNIWLITIGEPITMDASSKLRAMHLADKLLSRSHSVVFFASAFDHFRKEWVYETDTDIMLAENYRLIAIKGNGYKKNISLKRFIDHRKIARKFSALTSDSAGHRLKKPDVIVVSSPPHDLAYRAVRYARRNSIPILVDIRDEWPELFLNYVPGFMRGFFRVIFGYEFYMFRYAAKHATGIISMMNPLLEWGLKYANRQREKSDAVFYLGTKKPGSKPGSADAFMKRFNIPPGKFLVTFIGTFVSNNDPAVLVDCASMLKEKDIHFVLAGDGELLPVVKNKAKNLASITFTGWLNRDDISALLSVSDVGVCPSSLPRDAFPNKAFTYLANGVPVLTSFSGDLKEVIEENNAGFCYLPSKAEELAECILKLFEDKQLRKTQSENATRIFNEMFDAEKIYESYASHVEMVAENFIIK
jgi:glycosyltransferase involved in cell wall biosynthesis